MRFIEGGADIPDELLIARDEGRVVFFCGAGVSIARTRLPSFFGLATEVLDRLHATETSKARLFLAEALRIEREAGLKGVVPADRLFGVLESEFDRGLIGRAVAESLRPKQSPPDLSAHSIMLSLARQPSGQVRLVTTNFDRLFEACDKHLRSYTRSNLPRLEYAEDGWGIVNLHGRVRGDYSAPDSDGLVLSSAEFGDAYLAQGWARDFVHEILERYTAVFIGYSADDPPMRYLLEGLRYGSRTRSIFAFQEGPADLATALWDDRGVHAVAYEPANDHQALWETLRCWSLRAKDPAAWRQKIFARAKKGPRKLAPHERGMFAHIVSTTSGAVALRKASPSPPAEWLCVLDPSIRFQEPQPLSGLLTEGPVIDSYELYRLDSDPPRPEQNEKFSDRRVPPNAWDAFQLNAEDHRLVDDRQLAWIRGYHASELPNLSRRLSAIGDWIGEVALQPAAIWWAARQPVLHREVQIGIEGKIKSAGDVAAPEFIRSWRIIFQLWRSVAWHNHPTYDLRSDIQCYGWTETTPSAYADALAPRLKVESHWLRPIPPDGWRRPTARDLVRASVAYPEDFDEIPVPDDHLANVLKHLRTNLENAAILEREVGGWITFCSIEPDDGPEEDTEFARSYALSGQIVKFTNLFGHLIDIDLPRARAELAYWPSCHPIFSRLRIWAMGIVVLAAVEEFAAELAALSDEDFWDHEFNRDLLLAIARRWADFAPAARKELEARLLNGPPNSQRRARIKHLSRSAHLRLSRFFWLKLQGCSFSFDLDARARTWMHQAPDWKPEYAQFAAESHDGRSGTVKVDPSWEALADIKPAEVIEASKLSSGRVLRDLTERDPFRGLCEDAPLKAISAITLGSRSGKFPARYWETFLQADQNRSRRIRFEVLVGGRLASLQNFDIAQISLAVSRWFRAKGPELRRERPIIFARLWDRVISAIRDTPGGAESALVRQSDDVDWVSEAVNAPAGDLAELIMTDPLKNGLQAAGGFPAPWLALVQQLLELPGDSRRYALAIFVFNLNWFSTIDPEWTSAWLLAVLDNSPALDRDAFWAGFFWGARTPHSALYLELKPRLISMARNAPPQRKKHGEVLAGLLLNGWIGKDAAGHRYVSNDELRSVLLDADEQFRLHTLWHLEGWSSDTQGEWGGALGHLLQSVWPRHKKALTPQISARLCELALSRLEKLPAIVDIILPLLTKLEGDNTHISAIWNISKLEEIPDAAGVLAILDAVLPDEPRYWPYGAGNILTRLGSSEPALISDPRLARLLHRWEVR